MFIQSADTVGAEVGKRRQAIIDDFARRVLRLYPVMMKVMVTAGD